MTKFIFILIFTIVLSFVGFAQTQENRAGLNNQPLRITFQPKPNYTEQARKKDIDGKVLLRVEFLRNGEIGSVSVLKAKKKMYKNGLVEQAIIAAKKIKFTPAQKNGELITIIRTVEYTFNAY